MKQILVSLVALGIVAAAIMPASAAGQSSPFCANGKLKANKCK